MPSDYRPPDRLDTERYLLRRLRSEDAPAIFDSYAADPDVTRYLTWRPHRDVAETQRFVDRAAEEWRSGAGYPYVIAPHADPERLLGMIHPRVEARTIRFGYVLRRDVWGQGCAAEALRRLVSHALADAAIRRGEALCDVDNVASARVMEKAGLVYEGVRRRWARHPNLSDAPRDCRMYARVADAEL